MKINSRVLQKLIGVVGACGVRALLSTVSYKVSCEDWRVDPEHPSHAGRYIYAFWHESILAMIGLRQPRGMTVLISQHRDGEYVAQVAQRLRTRVVRGSSTRGGREALVAMQQAAKRGHLLITPDGPRGPRRALQIGAVLLAARTGLPIVPVGFGFTSAWRARSWDRFAVPRPFSEVTCYVAAPIEISRNQTHAELEAWRSRVEAVLTTCSANAEHWAARRQGGDCLRGAA